MTTWVRFVSIACAFVCLIFTNAGPLKYKKLNTESYSSTTNVVLRNPLVRAAALKGMSSSASAANKQLAASLGCMVDRWGRAILEDGDWPHESVNDFDLWSKDNHASECDSDPADGFNAAVASHFEDYSITQNELVRLLGNGQTPLKRLGHAVAEYTRSGAVEAFNSWTRGSNSLAKQGFDLTLDSKLPTTDTKMKWWRRIDYIPTEKGLLYLSNRDVLDGDFRLWAGARGHHVLSMIDSDLVPTTKYQAWRLPDNGQSLRIDIRDKPSQADVEAFLQELPRALEFIAKAVQEEHAIVVHCAAGQSRSVAVVLAHKIVAEGSSLAEAFAQVLAQRPQAMPNTYLMRALALLDDHLVGLPKGTQRYSALAQFVRATPKNIGDAMTATELERRIPNYSVKLADEYYKKKLATAESS